MSKQVKIEALRPFNRTAHGDMCEVGDVFAVDQSRAQQLQDSGLARPADSKAAPTPLNKMAPEPANKSKPVRLGG